jgi:hypothetical protein
MSDIMFSEHDDPKSVQMAHAMLAEGVNPLVSVPVDYFATGEDAKTMLPDGTQWVTHKVLTEGDRKRYLKVVQKDLKIQKGTQDMIMKLAAGEDRTALIEIAVTGWNLIRNGQPWPFTKANLAEFASNGPIKILDLVERDIRHANPWLLGEMSTEDIDQEIQRLTELRDEVSEREAGKSGSAS